MCVPLPFTTRRAAPSFPALVALWPPRPPKTWVAGGGAPGHSWNRMEPPDVRKRVPYTLGRTPRAAASLGVWGCSTGRAPEGDHSHFFSFGPGPRPRAAQSALLLSRLGSGKSVEICHFCTPRARRIPMPHIIFSSRCGSNEPSSGEIRPLITEIQKSAVGPRSGFPDFRIVFWCAPPRRASGAISSWAHLAWSKIRLCKVSADFER